MFVNHTPLSKLLFEGFLDAFCIFDLAQRVLQSVNLDHSCYPMKFPAFRIRFSGSTSALSNTAGGPGFLFWRPSSVEKWSYRG